MGITQTNFMIRGDGQKRAIDYIGKAEDLENEVAHILQDPDLKMEWHSGPGAGQMFKDEFRLEVDDLPPDTQRMLCELYKDDFCCFGFDFPEDCDTTCE